MTGYGQGSSETSGLRITVEMRAVNNRYADLRMRLPAELAGEERDIKRRILAVVRRGRVDMSLQVERSDSAEPGTALNQALLDEVVAATERLRGKHGIEGALDLATVLSMPGMLRGERPEVKWDDPQREAFRRAVEAALETLEQDRRREGAHLGEELLERLGALDALTVRIRERATRMPATLRDRLLERLKSLGGEVPLDPGRVAQEAVLLADRCDVTEEIVRLESHLAQARALLAAPDGDPLGRRLEFLLQELQREANTITSKSSDLELTRVALSLKSELEKVREQIQNLE